MSVIIFETFYHAINTQDRGGAHPVHAPPKIGENMIFWHKIVIFHTKYPKNFRASLRSPKPEIPDPPLQDEYIQLSRLIDLCLIYSNCHNSALNYNIYWITIYTGWPALSMRKKIFFLASSLDAHCWLSNSSDPFPCSKQYSFHINMAGLH